MTLDEYLDFIDEYWDVFASDTPSEMRRSIIIIDENKQIF